VGHNSFCCPLKDHTLRAVLSQKTEFWIDLAQNSVQLLRFHDYDDEPSFKFCNRKCPSWIRTRSLHFHLLAVMQYGRTGDVESIGGSASHFLCQVIKYTARDSKKLFYASIKMACVSCAAIRT
jgi:hypothetical protein